MKETTSAFWEGFEKRAAWWPFKGTVQDVKEITDNAKVVVKELGDLINPRKAAVTLLGASALIGGGASLGSNIGRRIGTLGEKTQKQGTDEKKDKK